MGILGPWDSAVRNGGGEEEATKVQKSMDFPNLLDKRGREVNCLHERWKNQEKKKKWKTNKNGRNPMSCNWVRILTDGEEGFWLLIGGEEKGAGSVEAGGERERNRGWNLGQSLPVENKRPKSKEVINVHHWSKEDLKGVGEKKIFFMKEERGEGAALTP